jgi:hypothetical protein
MINWDDINDNLEFRDKYRHMNTYPLYSSKQNTRIFDDFG